MRNLVIISLLLIALFSLSTLFAQTEPLPLLTTDSGLSRDIKPSFTPPIGNNTKLTLLTPANDATSVGQQPIFSWTALREATSYVLIVKHKAKTKLKVGFDATAICADQICTVDLATLPDAKVLKLDRTYKWRVKAITAEAGYKTDWQKFTVATSALQPRTTASATNSGGRNTPSITPTFTPSETPTQTYTPSATPHPYCTDTSLARSETYDYESNRFNGETNYNDKRLSDTNGYLTLDLVRPRNTYQIYIHWWYVSTTSPGNSSAVDILVDGNMIAHLSPYPAPFGHADKTTTHVLSSAPLISQLTFQGYASPNGNRVSIAEVVIYYCATEPTPPPPSGLTCINSTLTNETHNYVSTGWQNGHYGEQSGTYRRYSEENGNLRLRLNQPRYLKQLDVYWAYTGSKVGGVEIRINDLNILVEPYFSILPWAEHMKEYRLDTPKYVQDIEFQSMIGSLYPNGKVLAVTKVVVKWCNPVATVTPTLTPSPTATDTPTATPITGVTGFTLINAQTDQEVGSLVDGDVIDFAQLGTSAFNIRADTSPATVGSVIFGLDSNPTYRIRNGAAPYLIAGHSGTNYYGWTITPGTYTLTATAYTGTTGQGSMIGSPVTITITIVVDGSSPTATTTPSLTPTLPPTLTPTIEITTTPTAGGGGATATPTDDPIGCHSNLMEQNGQVGTRCLEYTPTPTATFPACPAMTIQTIDGSNILVRERPWGAVVSTVAPNTSINIYGGISDDETDGGADPGWWWYNGSGYIKENMIQSNSCNRHEILPPVPPIPAQSSECYVILTGASATVYDGNYAPIQGDVITHQNPIRVYGRDTEYPSSRYLISQPGMPQRWVTKSLFAFSNPSQYGCLDKTLGRFNRSMDPEYLRIVGYYANTFDAPVEFNTNNPYTAFRNTNPYVGGHFHTGVDLVFGPPDGFGTGQEFPVYARQNGVIVEAGPSGITGRFVMDNLAAKPSGFDRSGVEYSDGENSLYFAVTWDYDGDPTNDEFEQPANGYDYPSFGVQVGEIIGLTTGLGGYFRMGSSPCSSVTNPEGLNPLPSLPGCIAGPDRHIIIWYAENEAQGNPDIQSVYYHVGVDNTPNYPQWHDICSNEERELTWETTLAGLDPWFQSCRVDANTYMGNARWIGWSSSFHLHYEVFAYQNGGFSNSNRFDPLTAFQTFR